MNAHDAVIDLASVAVVLATDTHRLFATLGRAGFVHTADRIGMRMLGGDNLLTAISQFFFIPFDRFEKPLQRPRRGLEPQGNRLGRLAVNIRQLSLHVHPQQIPRLTSAETIGE